MSIFNILFRNSGQKARTLHPDDQSIPAGFRGVLEHEANLCIGCKTCAYVCSPGAITLETQPEGIAWQYRAVQCTFCSRCAEYCPTGAIHLDPTPHASLAAAPGALATQHLVEYQRCSRCNQPFMALPVPSLERLIGREVAPGENNGFDLAALMHLCEKCRSRVTSQRLKDSLIGPRQPTER